LKFSAAGRRGAAALFGTDHAIPFTSAPPLA
jgi:hypothetical protein